MKEENEKVIIDETFVLKFEDSTQPTKRIKQEPTDPEAKESKVFVDAITQTEALDADPKDPKVEIATQTDRPITYFCKLCNESYLSSDIMRIHLLSWHGIKKKDLDSDNFGIWLISAFSKKC